VVFVWLSFLSFNVIFLQWPSLKHLVLNDVSLADIIPVFSGRCPQLETLIGNNIDLNVTVRRYQAFSPQWGVSNIGYDLCLPCSYSINHRSNQYN
jgi:hypothetical protein